nr:glycosyltransferase family 2 protein [uncultured Noviherbaspirillum sp.]
MKKVKILISILNWNNAVKTLSCVRSLLSELINDTLDATIFIVDNGSQLEDFDALKLSMRSENVQLLRLPENIGFTGGHNVAIQKAMDENYDYVWLMNNDALVMPGALSHLLATMTSEERCGAVSPVLRDSENESIIARCVSATNWGDRTYTRIINIQEAMKFQSAHPDKVWLDGTAILLRVNALRDIGLLDNRLFAYYDDNDIGARLAAGGWHSRCVFEADVTHPNKKSAAEYPLYMSYLLQRNEMLFWHSNTPVAFRRMLWLKLFDRALFDVNKLYKRGLKAHGDVALLGVFDFICGKYGPPDYARSVPSLLRLACKISAVYYAKKLRTATIQSA